MAVNSREELNNYYNLLNNLVDEYTEKWKIRPSNLKRYLQPGSERFSKFLERNKLNDEIGKIVLRDIIQDRANMEADGVVNFQKFQIMESVEYKISSLSSCLYKGVENATQKMEKFLADYFDTNLSQIDIIDAPKHIFKVTDWNNENLNVIVYTDEEIELIRENIKEFMYEELSNQKVDIIGVELKLENLIDKQTFDKKIEDELNNELTIELIGRCLTGYELDNRTKPDGYSVWTSDMSNMSHHDIF
jgi:hypothetical protein